MTLLINAEKGPFSVDKVQLHSCLPEAIRYPQRLSKKMILTRNASSVQESDTVQVRLKTFFLGSGTKEVHLA